MAGANYMGGKKNAAKIRSRDAAGRQQKRFFGRQRLNLLSKRRSINSPTPKNQPQPSISLAHAKQNSTLSLSPRGYIPSPSKPWKSKRDGPSSASSSSKVLEALDTSEPISLRAAMNQILSLPDLAGLSTYKKRKRILAVSSPEGRMLKRVKSELLPETDEEELSSGSQNDELCDNPDASLREIYHGPDDEYDEEPSDAFLQAHLGSYNTSSSTRSSPVSAPSQRIPHIPIPTDVAQPATSFGTLAVTSSLQHSFSGNIFNYDDPWAAVGVILGLESAPSTPGKDADNTSALAAQPRPPSLAPRARHTVYSSDQASSEGIPVASSHPSDNVPPPQADEDDSYGQSDDFHFGEDGSDSDHDLDDQGIHDVPAHAHQSSSPSVLHLESHLPSAYFSSSNDHFNNLAGSPVAGEERKDVDSLFDHNVLLDDCNSDCHSQPAIDEDEDYADPDDADEYTSFETSSWAIPDTHQCVEEPIPDNHSPRFPSPDSLHRQDLITTEPSGVSPQYCSSPSVPAQISIHKDDLHVAQYGSSNASASSLPRCRAHRSSRTSHSSPSNAPLCLPDDAQRLVALPITINANTPSSDSLACYAQIVQDPEPAIEPAPELTDETFSANKTIHSAHSPASMCLDESVEAITPQTFAGFSLFSRDDFLEEPDSDD
ncbi:hypothetical protein EDD18DRAFT_1354417 [Armillaria luteobubalina]|uniref:Uncharacterized protein n=1 Tax=Armillaria luteobubalina TaxID=153913 RepID=A0AA39Q308_9AGAR|nr:hypothetical protein EDD18DRAFT_1354417 [Armillaria luteobubalina]